MVRLPIKLTLGNLLALKRGKAMSDVNLFSRPSSKHTNVGVRSGCPPMNKSFTFSILYLLRSSSKTCPLCETLQEFSKSVFPSLKLSVAFVCAQA